MAHIGKISGVAAVVTALLAGTAQAQLPAATRAMLDAAAASGEDASVDTVARFARQAHPADVAEIDGIVAAYRARAEERRVAQAAADREALAHRGLLEGWSGQGQIGASRATGNSSNTALSGGLALTRTGIDWTYKFRALADYQRSNGVTTQEQFLVDLSPEYRIADRVFLYGLGRWERDRFQGYSRRLTASGGLGYRAIDREDMRLDLRAGPAWRSTHYVGGGSESSLAGLADAEFGWQVSPNLRLGQTASALIEGNNSSFAATTSLDAKLVGALSARFSYTVEHDTDPPLGAVKTDTLTRVTLVYDF